MFAYCNNNPVVLCDTQGSIPAYSVMMTDGGNGTIKTGVKETNTVYQTTYWTDSKVYRVNITVEYQPDRRVIASNEETVVAISYRWDSIGKNIIKTTTPQYLELFDKSKFYLSCSLGEKEYYSGAYYIRDVNNQYAYIEIELYVNNSEMYVTAAYEIMYGLADAAGTCGGYVGSLEPWVAVPK